MTSSSARRGRSILPPEDAPLVKRLRAGPRNVSRGKKEAKKRQEEREKERERREQELARERTKPVRKLLKRAKAQGRLWMDWTETGASSTEEFESIAEDVSFQGEDPFFQDECLPFVLCSPVMGVTVKGDIPSGTIPGPRKYAPGLGGKSNEDWATNFEHMLNPVLYEYTGEWETDDLIGPLEDRKTGLYQKFLSAEDFERQETLEAVNGNRGKIQVGVRSKKSTICRSLQHVLERVESIVRPGEMGVSILKDMDVCSLLHGPNVFFAQAALADFTLISIGRNGSRRSQALMLVVADIFPSDRLVPCLKWAYYLSFEGEKPTEISKPNSDEMRRSLQMMTRLLATCLVNGMDTIVVSDCRSATAIRFEMEDAERDEFSGVIGFQSRTTYYDSVDLPMVLMLTAVCWNRGLELDNGSDAEKRSIIRAAAQRLRLTNEEILEHMVVPDGGSSIAFHAKKFEFEALQDYTSNMANRVFRIRKGHYEELFPKVTAETAVFKVLDMCNVDCRYPTYRDDYSGDYTYPQYKEFMVSQFDIEVECYRRVFEYNKTAERPIRVPDLLDYGVCCIDDESDMLLNGYYIVMEDLGDGRPAVDEKKDDPEAAVAEDLKLLESIGIIHCDVAWRNIIEKDGKPYLIDFNMASLDLSESEESSDDDDDE